MNLKFSLIKFPKIIQTPQNSILKKETTKSKLKRISQAKPDCFTEVPDEIIIYIFKFLSPQELGRTVSLVCRRFTFLWPLGVHTFELKGRIRKMKEDDFIKIFKKFVRLESFNICNSGSSEDFQLSDNGLLQLAHKYIYSDADLISRPTDPLTKEEEESDFDFNFDYESHLDSLDSSLIENPDNLETEFINDLDDLESEDEQSSISIGKQQEYLKKMKLKVTEKPQVEKKSTQEPLKKEKLTYYNSLKHSYFYYPPPLKNRKENSKKNEGEGPLYGLRTLHSLNLVGCTRLTEKGFKYLTYICSNVKHLNLKGCTKINDNCLDFIANFSQLESLNLTGCTHISDKGLMSLSKIKSKNLETLDLTFCHQITDQGIHCISQIPNIKYLDLTCCRNLTKKTLDYLGENSNSLISLNLTGCDKVILCEMKESIKSLKKIALMGCKETCDLCMKSLARKCPNLIELCVAYSDHITDDGIGAILDCNLSTLNLKRCLKITDKTLEMALQRLGDKLTTINVTGCRLISNKGLEYISQMSEIKEICVRRCYLINDQGLKCLESCKYLTSLDVSECHFITGEGIKSLCQSISIPKPSIDKRSSGLSNSPSLVDLMKKFEISKTGLKELKIESCHKVSKEVIDLMQHYYKLKIIYSPN